jgi:hypothetical protein
VVTAIVVAAAAGLALPVAKAIASAVNATKGNQQTRRLPAERRVDCLLELGDRKRMSSSIDERSLGQRFLPGRLTTH